MFPSGPDVPSWTEILHRLWIPEIWVFVGALLISLLTTPLFRWVAVRWGVTDKPDQAVKIHQTPIRGRRRCFCTSG